MWSQNSLSRHKNIPAAYLVLMNETGQVLLLRRFNTGYHDGMYSLVAGHVEENETYTQAVLREAKEEAGIDLILDKLKVGHVMHRKSDTDGSERVDIFYVAKDWQGEVCNVETDKCDELTWFDIEQLPENVIEYIKVALNNIQQGVFYSEVGW